VQRSRTKSLLIALALLAASGCTSLIHRTASPVLDGIRERGTLRIGMTGDYPPLNVKSRSGELIGFEPSLAKSLAQALDVQLELVEKPFAELLPALEAGEVDAVMAGMTMTPQRNMRVAFAGPYLVSGKAILSKSDSLARIGSLSDLKGVRVAVLESSTSQEILRRGAPELTTITTPDYDMAVRMVLNDEVDAMLADYPVCLFALLRHPDSGLAGVAAPLSFEPIGIAVSGDDPLLVNLMENYLTLLEGMGLLEKMRDHWFEDASWLAELP